MLAALRSASSGGDSSSSSSSASALDGGGLVKLVAMRRYNDVLKLLVARSGGSTDRRIRKDINLLDAHDNSALNYACSMGAPEELVMHLLAKGADCTSTNRMGGTPLSHAVYSHMSVAVLAALVKHGADPNYQNESGGTALQIACVCQASLKVMQALVDLGADAALPNAHGYTPLMFAVKNHNSIEIVTYLAQKAMSSTTGGSNNINAKVTGGKSRHLGYTALHFAALQREPAVCAILVRFGADIHITNQDGWSSLHFTEDDEKTRTAILTAARRA